MLKWIIGFVVAIALLVGGLKAFAPKIMLQFPELISTISRIVDPIEDTREVTWASGPATAAKPPGERPPNIVVILVDDLGFNDLTWNGGGVAGGTVPTPNIDSLARDGAQFTMGYAGNATCAPSRAALMTGRYGLRFGFESTPAPPVMGKMVSAMMNANLQEGEPETLFFEDRMAEVPPMNEQGMPGEEITIAELLKSEGYRTLMLGKWHVGSNEGMRPNDQGFDEFLGFRSGASMFGAREDPNVIGVIQPFDPIDQVLWKLLPFAIRKDEGPRFVPPDYMTDYLSSEAVTAIEANRNRPFFMYLAYNAPHTPLQAAKADYDALSHIESKPERIYAGMIRSLDRGVGEVLAALREHGLEENTLVIFSSDNGGAGYIGLPDINAPYRGWKMTFFEGGLHSPFFMKWPARIEGGTHVDEPVTHIDVFATAAAAGGATVPTDRKIDGLDLLPLATGEATELARDALFWRSGGLRVVLADPWKLQVDPRQKKSWLYNLDDDPTEQVNLVKQRTEVAKRLGARLDVFNDEIGPPAFPALVEGAIAIDRTLADPHVPGEEFAYWPN